MNKYLKAVSTNLFFFILSTVVFLIITPIAIHVMGEEFYGLWSILSAIMVFSTVGTMGINAIITKFASEKNPDNEESKILFSGVVVIIPMALITILILYLIRDIIISNIATSQVNKLAFRSAMGICILGILPLFMSRVPQGLLLSKLKNNIVRSLDFLSSVGPLVSGIIVCLFQKNLIWIAYCYTAIQFIILILYIFAIRNYLKQESFIDLSIIKKIYSFSIFTFIESLAIALFQNFDRIIVSFVLGPAVAGVYSVGNSIGTRLSQVVGQITDTMIPYASLKNSINDHQALYKTYRKMSKYIGFLVGITTSLCVVWMHEILSIWIAPDYADKYSDLFRIILLAYALLSLSRPGDQALTGLGRVKFAAITYMISSILMLTGVYFFSRSFGILGAGAANIIMCLLLIMDIKVYHILKSKVNWGNVISDLILGILIPILSFVFMRFHPGIYPRLIFSLITSGAVFILFMKDDYAREYLSSLRLKLLLNKK